MDWVVVNHNLGWLYKGLNTSRESGIPENTSDRERVFGSNKRLVRLPKGYFELLWDALQDFTMKILLLASVLEIGINNGIHRSDSSCNSRARKTRHSLDR
jgi:hypothetical protein